MSERPENSQEQKRGTWHSPSVANMWQTPQEDERPKVAWQIVKALPDNLSTEPEEKGAWHTPKPEDTTFSPDDKIEISDSPAITTQHVMRPEDLIAEVLGKSRPQSVTQRPEDMQPRPSSAAVDDSIDSSETLALTGLDSLEALGSMDDEADDDEAFSMSELMALASLEESAQSTAGLKNVNTRNLSPAERALYNVASAAADELPSSTQLLSPTQGTDDAAAYARKMAEQYGGQETVQFGDTSAGASTQSYQTVSPEQAQLAEQFRETRRQVDVLRQMYTAGQFDYQELQNRLQSLTIADPSGTWWMIGYETNRWYRYNQTTGQWEEANPPVALESSTPRTLTSELDPNEVIAGSLPYLPSTGQTGQEVSGTYGATQYNTPSQAGQPYNYQDTPIPNPDQPSIDPNRTVVGNAFDLDTLPHAAQTMQGLNYVDANAQATVPSAAVYQDATSIESPYGAQSPTGTATPPNYEAGFKPQTFEEYETRERASALTIALFGVGAAVIFGIIAVVGFLFYAQYQYNQIVEPYAAQIAALANRRPDFQAARIVDANGSLLELITGDQGTREVVDIGAGQVSPYFLHAIIASEDPRFYENAGVDILAIARAYVQNLSAGEIQSGASTITQQIVKNLIIRDSSATAERKLAEAFVAMEVARQYDKTDVLNVYINEFFFGNQSYGVEAAAQFYFNKSARDLNMAESALLVGLLPSPVATNPVRDRETSFRNMEVVLRRMIDVNCITFEHNGQNFCINTAARVDDGAGNQVPLFSIGNDGTYGGFLALQIGQVETRTYELPDADLIAPHFVNYVTQEVERIYGRGALTQRGFTVYTTLVPRIQNVAEEALAAQVNTYSVNGIQTGAVVVLDPRSGAIMAMVGSPDFNNVNINGQFNIAADGYQQPGSAIKPILYSAALTNRNGQYFTPASILWDVPSANIDGQGYTPTNFNPNEYNGPVSVRSALQRSLNIPAVKTYLQVGQTNFVQMANALGVTFQNQNDPANPAVFGAASALGANETTPLMLTHAYATIANDGRYMPVYAIQRITERINGQEVDVALPERQQAYQAVDAGIAYLMQHILSDHAARSNAFGSVGEALAGAQFGLPNINAIAAKTGTSSNSQDLWTVGFTNNVAVGVWVGTLDNTSRVTNGLTGSRVAAPIWNAVMREALLNNNPGQFQAPTNVRQDLVCTITGTLAPNSNNCPAPRVSEFYIAGQEPPSANNGFVQTIAVDSWTGLRANANCSDPENIIQGQYANISDPYAVTWLNTTGRSLLQAFGVTPPLLAPPSGECQPGQLLPTVRLNFPNEGAILQNTVSVTGQINAPELRQWQLAYSPQGSNNFTPLVSPSAQQVPTAGQQLASWDTKLVPNGTYIVRLEALSNSNGLIVRNVTVRIDNIIPTSTPAPTIQPTLEGFTPLPFGGSNG